MASFVKIIRLSNRAIKPGFYLGLISLTGVSCATLDMSVSDKPSNQASPTHEEPLDTATSPTVSIDQLSEGLSQVCGLLSMLGISCDLIGSEALTDASGDSKPGGRTGAVSLPKTPQTDKPLKLPEPNASSLKGKTPNTTLSLPSLHK